MKRILWSLLLILMFSYTSKAQSISTLKWKNRVVILMDAQGNQNILNKQLSEFKGLEEEITARDLIIFCYDGKSLLDRKLKSTSFQLSREIDPEFQGIILIGKDGGIKLKKPFVVEAKTIFDTIDRMPMRKAEMRKSGNN